jgi:diacylglycerol kinase family enzyme
MPTEIAEAARAIAAGTLVHVDAGAVNGRTFINNSSIGLYPELVRARDAEQRATGHGKWRAMLTAAWRVLRRFPLVAVHVHTDRGALLTRTPFVFVGNNAYTISPLALGQRARLDRGHLSLYTMRCRSRLELFWLTLRAIFQRADRVEDFEADEVDEVEVVLPRRRVRVALDGEVVTLTSPLRYTIRAGALPVLRPPAVEAARDEAA